MERVISLLGLFTLLLVAFVFSTDRRKINYRTVVAGLLLQAFLGVIILKTQFGRQFFEGAKDLFTGILNFTQQGSKFVFGSLATGESVGFIFATMVLPTIIFMSALMGVLYHLGIMQIIIKGLAKVMTILMGTSGAESLAAAANVFAGQTEAPLVIRPYISKMTRSELMALMTGGMATVAGGVLAAYVGMGMDAGHLLSASVMAAPASLLLAKILVPETGVSVTRGEVTLIWENRASNVIEAAAVGASEGLFLALNVAGMLLAFIALIAMANGILGWAGQLLGYVGVVKTISIELLLGYMFAPFAWLIGVPWQDCLEVGGLLGKKVVLNEFIAYSHLKSLLEQGTISPRAVTLSTYALCGFANFGSIAIQLGGIGTLAPERRQDLAQLGLRALLGGTLAGLMTAAIAGIFL